MTDGLRWSNDVPLDDVRYCPLCGRLSSYNLVYCDFDNHALVKVQASPPRLAAFLLEGSAGVRAIAERGPILEDAAFCHPGSWKLCGCTLCDNTRHVMLSA